jgi:hypothetical protein
VNLDGALHDLKVVRTFIKTRYFGIAMKLLLQAENTREEYG